jgi:hypothetical protein
MVALLYRECICLATPGKFDQIYTIQACIALADIKLEEVDNGRGMSYGSDSALVAANGCLQDSNATPHLTLGKSCFYMTASCMR